ncbi:MAG TPA: UDP-N-acetylmuramate dehydrogenase [Gemmataceae bacterium]|jgi:UDP-N-acetylmuramate dehydrogenase|nr:UDP-N-acetylmuramate dehydrogenase [Gemmataceae bacterium]
MGFRDEFAAIIQAGQPLAPFTHLRIGGPAEYLVAPRTRDEFARVVAACAAERIPLRVLGVGTNLLVRDEGVTGVVVRMIAPEFTNVSVSGRTVKAGGGATLLALIRAATTAGLAGFETLVGITATVGGALRFNAGDRSGEIADHLTRVEVIDKAGKIVTRQRGDIRFGEHDSDLDDPVVLAVEFALEADDPDAIVKRMRRAWINRKADQPLSHQSAVRVFRNPQGQTAAHLIERAGLVGSRVGAATVSDRNANYIVAQPGTTAADVIALADKMRSTVRNASGVTLEQELKVW